MSRRTVLAIVLILVAVAVVGNGLYRAGVARGLSDAARIAPPPPGTVPYPYYGPYWHPGPFGFGFFGFLFPLLFLFLLFGVFRAIFWRRHWGGPHGEWKAGGLPPMFEQWHRRAHESPGDPGASGSGQGQGPRV